MSTAATGAVAAAGFPRDTTSRNAQIALLAGALTLAFSAILVRLADVSPETAAFFRCLLALPVLGVLTWKERRRLGPRSSDWVKLGAAGVLFACDIIFWHHAIENVGAGLATVLGNMQVVLVACVAWAVLGERPETRVLAAVPIVLTGVVLIAGVVEHGAYGANPALGVVYGALTSVTYAGFILLLRAANAGPSRPAGPLFVATAVSALCCIAYGGASGSIDVTPSAEAMAWLTLLALSAQVLAWMLISWALPRLAAALASVLLLVQPLGAVLLAAVLLREEPSLLQLGGVGVVVAGVLVATRGPVRSAPPPLGADDPSRA